jgi:DNA-binding transcriptional MocR family regulator
MAPGLRIGYLASLGEDTTAFGEAMRSTIYMAAPLTAEIASRWIVDGTGDRLARVRRAEYARRQDLAARILGALPRRTQPSAMHLWLELPDHWPADAFALEARIRGAAVCPTSNFAQVRNAANGVRVSLSAPRRLEDLERGLSIIAALCKSRPNRDNDIV